MNNELSNFQRRNGLLLRRKRNKKTKKKSRQYDPLWTKKQAKTLQSMVFSLYFMALTATSCRILFDDCLCLCRLDRGCLHWSLLQHYEWRSKVSHINSPKAPDPSGLLLRSYSSSFGLICHWFTIWSSVSSLSDPGKKSVVVGRKPKLFWSSLFPLTKIISHGWWSNLIWIVTSWVIISERSESRVENCA